MLPPQVALWQAAVFGFGGLRVQEEAYTTKPCLPAHWERLAFNFYLRGRRHTVELHREPGEQPVA
jgi:trehalose/maltose hydrolase-like predicted phosphorylase